MGDEAGLVLYEKAVDLYAHEDQLNWVKLNNLFYVNGGLLAILGFVLDTSDGLIPLSGTDAALVRIVAVFGLFVSAVFCVALHYGVKYLLTRKAAVARLERRLSATGPSTDHDTPADEGSREENVEVSPTSILLRVTPYVIAAGWTFLLILTFL